MNKNGKEKRIKSTTTAMKTVWLITALILLSGVFAASFYCFYNNYTEAKIADTADYSSRQTADILSTTEAIQTDTLSWFAAHSANGTAAQPTDEAIKALAKANRNIHFIGIYNTASNAFLGDTLYIIQKPQDKIKNDLYFIESTLNKAINADCDNAGFINDTADRKEASVKHGFAAQQGKTDTAYWLNIVPLPQREGSDELYLITGHRFYPTKDTPEQQGVKYSWFAMPSTLVAGRQELPIDETALPNQQQTTFTQADRRAVRIYQQLPAINGEDVLALVTEKENNALASGALSAAILTAVGALIITILHLVTNYFLNKKVTKPLLSIADEVDKMTTTGCASVLPVDNKEINRLIYAINNMVARTQMFKESAEEKETILSEMHQQANLDTLTHLPNRAATVKHLTTHMENSGVPFTVYFVDLHRFKSVNEIMGRHIGDKIINTISERLQEEFDENSHISRIGGDEFMVCVFGETTRIERHYMAEKILFLFETPVAVNGKKLTIRVNVGSSYYPEDAVTVEKLMENAELSLNRAKKQAKGDGGYALYRAELELAEQQRIEIEGLLQQAVEQTQSYPNDSEFEIHCQPKLCVETKKIVSCEALIRWKSGKLGTVNPDEFMEIAEESGLILPLSFWIFKQSYAEAKVFEKHGLNCSVAVNVSAQVLLDNEFISNIKEAAHAAQLSLQQMDIEIVETALVEDLEKVNIIIGMLHSMGMQVTIDDFGTQYSALSYLNRLEVDRIKIDRSFVSKIEKSPKDQAIIKAIIDMGKSLGIIITAEGVENKEQYHFLKELGVEEMQGYIICKPLPMKEFIQFTTEWNNNLSAYRDRLLGD